MSRSELALVTIVTTLVASCTLVSGLQDFTFNTTDGDADSDVEAEADVDGDTESDAESDADHDDASPAVRPVDMLFVVDNSSGMGPKQRVFIEAATALLRELVVPTADPIGTVPPAVADLHVGVISTDMGSGGQTLPTCSDDPFSGDDGRLHAEGMRDGCMDSYNAGDCRRARCPWLTHSTEHPDDGSIPDDSPIWDDFSCIAELGTSGCGFEQPLESALTALTTQAAPGNLNAGFLRDDSVLVLVFVTDEDDCSAADDHMFDPDQTDPGPYNVRCALRTDLLEPPQRYIEAFKALHPAEGAIVVAAMVGVPSDGSWEPGDPLDVLRELVRTDPENPTQMMPICEDGVLGLALVPTRIVEVVYGFGERGIIGSICDPHPTSLTRDPIVVIREAMLAE